MDSINVLFDDYCNFSPDVINHYNITKNNAKVDLLKFKNVVSNISDGYNSNVNIHFYDYYDIPRITNNIIDTFNKYNVEVTLSIDDTIDNDFLITYYMDFAKLDRLTVNFTITGYVDIDRIKFLLTKLHSLYKIFHIYDINPVFFFSSGITNKIVDFLDDCFLLIIDNRKSPLPLSLNEYMLNDIVTRQNKIYVPYDMLIENCGKICINQTKIGDITFNNKSLDTVENINDVLQDIHNKTVEQHKCKDCLGYKMCKILDTAFKNNNCMKTFEYMWNKFIKYAELYDKTKIININNRSLDDVYH